MKIDIQDYIEYVYINDYCTRLDEYIGTNLIYEYKCNGEWNHTHDFVSLLKYILGDIFEYDDAVFDFSECRDEYSEQELIIIDKLITQAKKDKEKYGTVLKCYKSDEVNFYWKLP
jgi:hypothetical protein